MYMDKPTKIEGLIQAWEDRELGCDENFVQKSSLIDDLKLDETLRLKTISIRMEETLIDDLKLVAQFHGVKYQPLVKQVLRRFVDVELKEMIKRFHFEEKLKKAQNCNDDISSACG